LSEACHAAAGGIHFAKDPIGVGQELFAGLGQHDGLAHPVKKATAHVRFEGLDGMADGGLGEEEFTRSLREAACACEDNEGVELAGVDRWLH
jgi:hypothetical protein